MELKYYAGKDVLDALLDCMERISKQDGADVVEVVRCKDCGWWNEDDSAGWGHLGNNVCACAYFSNEDGYTVYTEPNDYCSKGQREEDE